MSEKAVKFTMILLDLEEEKLIFLKTTILIAQKSHTKII